MAKLKLRIDRLYSFIIKILCWKHTNKMRSKFYNHKLLFSGLYTDVNCTKLGSRHLKLHARHRSSHS